MDAVRLTYGLAAGGGLFVWTQSAVMIFEMQDSPCLDGICKIGCFCHRHRRRACRKHYDFAGARRAAIKLQAKWRAHKARQEYLKSKSSAVLIQASFRGARARGEYAMQV